MRKFRKTLAILLLILGLIAAGCAQKKVVKPEAEKPVEQAEVQKAEEVAPKPAEQEQAKVESAELPEKYKEKGSPFKDIYFDYDRYEIRSDAEPVLKEISSYLISNPEGVLIEGHCDDRGTNEYNLALGDRRATAAKNYLAAGGVAKKKIDTISYGEERPQCQEQTENCWAKNRRAHFVVIEAGK